MSKIFNYFYNLLPYVILLAVIAFLAKPIFHAGLFITHDDVQVVRIDLMTQALQASQFPVRYIDQLANGGGYLLFNFNSQLIYYTGAGLHLLGLTLFQVVKLLFLFAYLIGAVGMFLLVFKITDKNQWLAVLGSILFITSTYLNYDLFHRGALAELSSFILLPWFFWALFNLKAKQSKIYFLMVSCFWAAIILAHTIIGLACSFCLGIFLLLNLKNKNFIITCVLAGFFGIGLAAYFFLPAIYEQQFTIYSQTEFGHTAYKAAFLEPLQLAGLTPSGWGILPPLLGINLFIGGFIACLVLGYKLMHNKYQGDKQLVIFAITTFLTSLFFISAQSQFLWDLIPYLRFMQFPYRFLTVTTVFAIILIILLAKNFKSTVLKYGLPLVLIVSVFLLHQDYFKPVGYNYASVYRAEGLCPTTTWQNEYLPIWTKQCLPKVKKLALIDYGKQDMQITNLQSSPDQRLISFTKKGNAGTITIAKYYFPGWNVYIDETKTLIKASGKYGLITFSVDKGTQHIQVKFENSFVRDLGNIISLCSLVIVGWMLCSKRFFHFKFF
ncbi:hypothetical protein GYA49_00320 [Candidatus Beckwithbacteria bacterium]|nr:hypothetical protein [Candidatus Beckwithbacteria bacterium]